MQVFLKIRIFFDIVVSIENAPTHLPFYFEPLMQDVAITFDFLESLETTQQSFFTSNHKIIVCSRDASTVSRKKFDYTESSFVFGSPAHIL